VLLAAAGSSGGASRFVLDEASVQGWVLVTADYCAEEVRRNLPKLVPSAPKAWQQSIAPVLEIAQVRLALNKALIFPKAKDRPVVITALAERCDWLLTLDEADFHGRIGRVIYGMGVATPGQFLLEQRKAGRL
jgi:hypothetical protein